MFDVLGIIAFLVIIYSIFMLIISIFSRKVNVKLWGLVCGLSFIILFTSYTLDLKFGSKKEDIKIDYSDVVIETPTPTPPTPTPVITPTPIASYTKEPTTEPTIRPTAKPTKKPVRTPDITQNAPIVNPAEEEQAGEIQTPAGGED